MMAKRLKPYYIGITDFETPKQAQAMADLFAANIGTNIMRKLMVGVMMSYKTLNRISTSWAGIWPPSEHVSSIFINHTHVLNTLHYADCDGRDVYNSIIRAAIYGGDNLHALQLDMIWPSPKDLIGFKESFPNIALVLQIGGPAFAAVGDSPGSLVERLATYDFSIDYILLDKSMGRGIGMQAERLRPFIEAIYKSNSSISVGVAGGLGPTSLHLVEPLIREFPQLNIDAQGRLRPSSNMRDPIDWILASTYLTKAIQMFKA